MAACEQLDSNSPIVHSALTDRLAKELPKDSSFKLYHISTPPRRTSPLYQACPGERSDCTYCESHFLTLSINVNPNYIGDGNDGGEVLVFAIEILIYSTAYLTTIFVSKADSTGYLHLLNLPKGSPSPLKGIASEFLAYLVEERRRQGIRSVVSLFARAQDQYLFPGSVENSGKHVLDDRGLVKWWCRVLDSLVESSKRIHSGQSNNFWDTIRGYLIVPGLDEYESKSYLPKGQKAVNTTPQWTIGCPLKDISRYRKDVPPRCLIPHFPDDPKSRFLDELDDDLFSSQGKPISGEWKSIKTLDQFWETMAFRQECSAGRLVGFIWVVFSPVRSTHSGASLPFDSRDSVTSLTSNKSDRIPSDHGPCSITSNTPTQQSKSGDLRMSASKSSNAHSVYLQQSTSLKLTSTKNKRLSGPIVARKPRVKTEKRLYWSEMPEKTLYYVWPQSSRGQVVVTEKDYKRITELLLRLDFANLALAIDGTRRWVSEVRSGVSGNAANGWGSPIIGTKALGLRGQSTVPEVTTLNVGLVRKRKKQDEKPETTSPAKDRVDAEIHLTSINILCASVVRKKPRT